MGQLQLPDARGPALLTRSGSRYECPTKRGLAVLSCSFVSEVNSQSLTDECAHPATFVQNVHKRNAGQLLSLRKVQILEVSHGRRRASKFTDG